MRCVVRQVIWRCNCATTARCTVWRRLRPLISSWLTCWMSEPPLPSASLLRLVDRPAAAGLGVNARDSLKPVGSCTCQWDAPLADHSRGGSASRVKRRSLIRYMYDAGHTCATLLVTWPHWSRNVCTRSVHTRQLRTAHRRTITFVTHMGFSREGEEAKTPNILLPWCKSATRRGHPQAPRSESRAALHGGGFGPSWWLRPPTGRVIVAIRTAAAPHTVCMPGLPGRCQWLARAAKRPPHLMRAPGPPLIMRCTRRICIPQGSEPARCLLAA